MSDKRFSQVDVFCAAPFRGNPVAVVHNADDLTDAQMQDFARWTNLSETTFLLAPTHSDADYRLRIFTPARELPFAGHPTLGSCHAWLEQQATPPAGDLIRQECAAGVITVRRSGGMLSFEAPPRVRTGPLDVELVTQLVTALSLPPEAVIGHQWVDNGPGWCALLLDSARRVRRVVPDFTALGDQCLGIVGPCDDEDDADFEVRAFVPGMGVPEDPVTGSLNASLAQWLMGEGIAAPQYTAVQGSVIGRAGKILLKQQGAAIWVGGATRTVIQGQVSFDADSLV